MFTQKLATIMLSASLGLFSTYAMAHPGHMDPQDSRVQSLVLSIQSADEKVDSHKTTDQGDLTFKVLRTSSDLLDRDKGAPIDSVKDGEVTSTFMIKEDLGLSTFTHVHNALMLRYNDTYDVTAQAWIPGNFTIFKQVK